jgi:hypothetical protein
MRCRKCNAGAGDWESGVERDRLVQAAPRLDLDYDRSERLAKLLKSDDGNLEEIAKLLGQSGSDPKL